jgi:hypothetical protein
MTQSGGEERVEGKRAIAIPEIPDCMVAACLCCRQLFLVSMYDRSEEYTRRSGEMFGRENKMLSSFKFLRT